CGYRASIYSRAVAPTYATSRRSAAFGSRAFATKASTTSAWRSRSRPDRRGIVPLLTRLLSEWRAAQTAQEPVEPLVVGVGDVESPVGGGLAFRPKDLSRGEKDALRPRQPADHGRVTPRQLRPQEHAAGVRRYGDARVAEPAGQSCPRCRQMTA